MKTKSIYIFGRNSVIEALNAGKDIEKIFIAFGAKGGAISKIYNMAKSEKISCVQYDKRKFAAMEKQACPPGVKSQGVIALVSLVAAINLQKLVKKSFEKEKYPVLVALDGITDPHNLGAIARSVECSGAAGLILPERNSAPITPVAIKSSAGALEHLPVAKVVNLTDALMKCKDEGFWVLGTDENAKVLYTGNHYDRPLIIVIGSEGKGIGHSTAKHCDILVKIPLEGRITSLNASVAAGIMLFEMKRQRGKY